MMCGIAEATERIDVWCTISMLAQDPALAARQAVTLDHISNGRSGINLVAGAYPAEFTQSGIKLPSHTERYSYATEWISVVKKALVGASGQLRREVFPVRGLHGRPPSHWATSPSWCAPGCRKPA